MRIILVALTILLIIGGIFYILQRPAISPSIPATPTLSPTPANPLITVTNPQPGATVPHTLQVSGTARGSWYFEASFPLRIEDASGTVLVSTPAHAQGDWMTTDFVPFTATLQIPASYAGKATLIAEKDNPSGLPENAASIHIPITIK